MKPMTPFRLQLERLRQGQLKRQLAGGAYVIPPGLADKRDTQMKAANRQRTLDREERQYKEENS